jgi:predicted ester cyclase
MHPGRFKASPKAHEWIHSAFADAQVTIEDQVAEGDKVVSRYTVSGAHQGRIMGAAPTGKLVRHTGHQTNRISGATVTVGYSVIGAVIASRLPEDPVG